MSTFTNHPQRFLLNDEVHARPYEALHSPERISYLALLSGEHNRTEEYQCLKRLCTIFGCHAPELAESADSHSHVRLDLGLFRLKWERHTEFSSYTFIQQAPCDDPFAEPVLNKVPDDWLAHLPGQVVVASHGALRAGDKDRSVPDLYEIGQLFNSNPLIGAQVSDGSATVFTDFRIQADGFSRFLILDSHLGSQQAGRLMQRLLEIETYRMMALLAFPIARETRQLLDQADEKLEFITRMMPTAQKEDDPNLLDELMQLAALLEKTISANHYRFSAARAYYELVQARITELREQRLQGLQTFHEFMTRRLAPAMGTCEWVASRQQRLSERIARTSELLRTRVDVTREKQNQALLASMDRRAELQLRLQETVEGLSVAAITYYTVSLVGYLAKGLKSVGLAVNPELAMGVAIPVVAGLLALGVRHIRHSVAQAERE